ncbi:helix-turn-helix domain-containing protein [Schumannella sp. 10F1B-5-1]|uniref:helix-turn-helix domain-containing protein n=1 Tax=Schumannella sp. 10F1B-5-1 TaxID=2590780 RepID=UPI00113219D0|nr:helix-turn-helix domain-containing protein [Schumannella sp. 10F1B-5-1]TPW71071.1 helix-turn-helix domain-containing protein [Schumannella sp. 10F1B-5-1]
MNNNNESIDSIRPPGLTSPIDPHQFLDPEAVSALLMLTVPQVYHYRKQGLLPPGIQIGKHLRWHRESLIASVFGQTHENTALPYDDDTEEAA